MKTIESIDQLQEDIDQYFMHVVVFSTRSCVVCKPLKEKIKRLLEPYDQIHLSEVYIEDVEAAKGLYQVYTAPITLLFVDGKEAKRYGAAMNPNDFLQAVERYYAFM